MVGRLCFRGKIKDMHGGERTMKYRHDLVKWRFKQSGFSYRRLAALSGCGIGTAWDFVNGRIDPTASTIKEIFETLRLNPKYAMDFTLSPEDFILAIVEADFFDTYAPIVNRLQRIQ